METGCEMKRKERKGLYIGRGGGGGGGGGGSKKEKGFKCLLNGWFKKKGKLMMGARNEGFVADGR